VGKIVAQLSLLPTAEPRQSSELSSFSRRNLCHPEGFGYTGPSLEPHPL